MKLQSLGYIGVRTKDIDQWATSATRFLGMQLADKSRGTPALRMDDRKQRVAISADDGEGLAFSVGKSPATQRSSARHASGTTRRRGRARWLTSAG
jgi:hypothetical protein